MGTGQALMRVVFDTNTVISALLFRGSMAWLVPHWQSGEIAPLISRDTAQEFLRVLAYPKFGLSELEIHTLAARYLPYAECIDESFKSASHLLCRDENDQKFIALANAGKADVLVTGDRDLLALRDQAAFAIVMPTEYRLRYEKLS